MKLLKVVFNQDFYFYQKMQNEYKNEEREREEKRKRITDVYDLAFIHGS
jgi:hypothetical protein